MLEFGVPVTTDELVALERALRALDTDAARSALTKAHRTPVALASAERDAVLSALGAVLAESAADESGWVGLARLATKLEHVRDTAVDERPPPRRTRSTKK